MPLATKNGSLIVKSGSIAENCNCCASGWYCCRQFPTSAPLCSPLSFIGKVTAVVTSGADYVLEQRVVDAPCSYGFPPVSSPRSGKIIIINPTSHYAGTYELSAPTSGGEWRYNYPPDGAGNAGYLSLSVTATSSGFNWSLVFAYHYYAWQKHSPAMPSESKSLSDMRMGFTHVGTGTISNCFSTTGEYYNGVQEPMTFTGSRTLCAASEARTYTGTMVGFKPTTLFFPESYTSVVSETGTRAVTIQLSIELK